MADEELIQQAVNGVRQLEVAATGREGVEGKDLAEHLGIKPARHHELYDALQVARDRGRIAVFHWPGGMELPEGITIP